MLCFPSAGSAEDMFTSEGTGARKAPSPLLVSTASGPPAGAASCWPSVLGRKQAAGLEPGKIGAHALQGAACTKKLVRQVLSKDEEHVQALRGLLRGLLCPLHSPRNASAS